MQSEKLTNYSNLIFESSKNLSKVNYTPSENYEEDNEEDLYEYRTEIMGFKQINDSLINIFKEKNNLEQYLGSKADMLMSMSVSVLVLSTLFSLIGLLGKFFFCFFSFYD